MNPLRRTILAQRDALTDSLRISWSHAICARLQDLLAAENLQFPMFYVSFRSEVATHGIIRSRLQQGLFVAVPITYQATRKLEPRQIISWNQLTPGTYGILEPDAADTIPVPPSKLDAVIVPGSVFDLSGGRYGYGGGYYDRFLQNDAPQAVRIGLAFDFQVLNHIPLAQHDQRLDWILTEKRVIRPFRSLPV